MESRKRRIDHLTALSGNVKQYQRTPVGIKSIHSQGMLRGMTPRTVCQFIKVRVRRDEEELLRRCFRKSVVVVRVRIVGRRGDASVGEGGVGC